MQGSSAPFTLITCPNYRVKDMVINWLKKASNKVQIFDNQGNPTGRYLEWSTHQCLLDRLHRVPLQCIAQAAKQSGYTQDALIFQFRENELWTKVWQPIKGEWEWKLQGKAHYNAMTGIARVIVNTEIFDVTLEQWSSLWQYYSGETMQQELTPNEQNTYDAIRRASQKAARSARTSQLKLKYKPTTRHTNG